MKTAYDLLSEARELLGKAHDKIAAAIMDHRGAHQPHLVGVCPAIEELIEKLNDACGQAD